MARGSRLSSTWSLSGALPSPQPSHSLTRAHARGTGCGARALTGPLAGSLARRACGRLAEPPALNLGLEGGPSTAAPAAGMTPACPSPGPARRQSFVHYEWERPGLALAPAVGRAACGTRGALARPPGHQHQDATASEAAGLRVWALHRPGPGRQQQSRDEAPDPGPCPLEGATDCTLTGRSGQGRAFPG